MLNREDITATATTQGIECAAVINGYRVHAHYIGYGYTFDEAIDAFYTQNREED